MTDINTLVEDLRRAHEYLDQGKPFLSGKDCAEIADLIEHQSGRIAALEAKVMLYAASLNKADKDTARLDFLVVNIKRYRFYESKGFWYCVPVTAQGWQTGYKSAREAIDAAEGRKE